MNFGRTVLTLAALMLFTSACAETSCETLEDTCNACPGGNEAPLTWRCKTLVMYKDASMCERGIEAYEKLGCK